jgi:hypothetical protein
MMNSTNEEDPFLQVQALVFSSPQVRGSLVPRLQHCSASGSARSPDSQQSLLFLHLPPFSLTHQTSPPMLSHTRTKLTSPQRSPLRPLPHPAPLHFLPADPLPEPHAPKPRAHLRTHRTNLLSNLPNRRPLRPRRFRASSAE